LPERTHKAEGEDTASCHGHSLYSLFCGQNYPQRLTRNPRALGHDPRNVRAAKWGWKGGRRAAMIGRMSESKPLPPERSFKDGEAIIEQGEPAMEAFLITGGAAGVFTNGQKIASLHEGDIFGEAALFKGSDYGASVKADGALSVQPITPDILDEKISRCDPMLRALIRMMMVRLRRTNERLSKAGNPV